MKKFDLGVVTFFDANNYGAALQTFALQEFLKNNKITSCVLNVQWKEPEKINSIRGFLYYLKNKKHIKDKKQKFDNFIRTYTNLSNPFTSNNIKKANDLCSRFIVGSDQVWNSQWNYNRNVFYLTFADKRFSYAASFGSVENINKYRIPLIFDDLIKFNYVSVREKSAKDFLSKLGIESQVHIDPTFLLTTKEWERIVMNHSPVGNKNYVLIYSLEKNEKLINDAKQYAKKNNLDIYIIVDTNKKKYCGIKTIAYCSPEMFVTLFSNSNAIFTNSFHGTAFSIIFNKPFYTYLQTRKNAPNDRIVDLLSDLQLSDCIIKDTFKVFNASFSYCNRFLENQRAESLIYLKKINDGEYDHSRELPFTRKYYYCKSTNPNIVASSRSGGISAEIANQFLEKGNSAYGAILKGDSVILERLINSDDVKLASNSKYVDSQTGTSFEQVAKDLNKGLSVFYSALPCQINALISYLDYKKIDRTKLLTADIVCHGAPQSKYFKDYLNYLRNIYHHEILNFNFRDKNYGWDTHFETFNVGNKKIKSRLYTKLFYSNYLLKDSCFNCPFASFNHKSDITLMDSWGYTKPSDLKSGSSIAIINTEKGLSSFKSLKNISSDDLGRLEFIQPNLIAPSNKPKDLENFKMLYSKKTFIQNAKFAIKDINKQERKNRIKKSILKIAKCLGLK